MGNPFQNESSVLLSLDTKNIANPSLAQLVAIHHQRGLKQVEVFLGGLHKEEGMSEITANRDSSSTSEYAKEHPRKKKSFVDGSATTPPRSSKTYEDYALEYILLKIKFYGATYKRVDVVFDVYRRFTLKGEARVRRGQSMRRRGTGTSKTPTNWRSFLRDDDNKTALFQFLTDRICQTRTTSTILVTKEGCVICNANQKSLEAVSP